MQVWHYNFESFLKAVVERRRERGLEWLVANMKYFQEDPVALKIVQVSRFLCNYFLLSSIVGVLQILLDCNAVSCWDLVGNTRVPNQGITGCV